MGLRAPGTRLERMLNTNQINIGTLVEKWVPVDTYLFGRLEEGSGCRSHHDFAGHRGPFPSRIIAPVILGNKVRNQGVPMAGPIHECRTPPVEMKHTRARA